MQNRNRRQPACRLLCMFALTVATTVLASRAAIAAGVPSALQTAIDHTLANDAGTAFAIGTDGCATLPSQSLDACFDKGGAHFGGTTAASLALHLAAFGRGPRPAPEAAVAPNFVGNRASYAHRDVTEWWRILPTGFEQGFTVASRPAGTGPLMLVLSANRTASGRHGDVAWGRLRYGKLAVIDAAGRSVPATMSTRGRRVRIAIDDLDATYPLTVDPLVWNEQKVTANDGVGGDFFGYTVAMSGNVALVGSPFAASSAGAVYVFMESGGTWTQTQKLTPSNGAQDGYFGRSLAIDGTTALIGAPAAGLGGAQGAVYVFSESNDTWSQTQELQAIDGVAGDSFGSAVAMHGSTAMVSAPRATVNGNYAQGAVYVFTDSNGSWIQAQKLISNDGAEDDFFGRSLALLADTAVVGEDYYNLDQGTAYVFTKSAGSWSQTQQLFASDGVPNDHFGEAVALYGTTVLVSSPQATVNGHYAHGAVYVYTDSGGTWDQTQKLTPNDDSRGFFGLSIATGDAEAFIGAPYAAPYGNTNEGVVYRFSEYRGVWSQRSVFASSDPGPYQEFGYSIAFNGTVALIGAVYDNYGVGAAYVDTAGCPQGYNEYDGSLNPGAHFDSPPYRAPRGPEHAILGAPDGFGLSAQYSNGHSQRLFRIPGNEIYRPAPAGTYRWGVKAGATGGDYTLCILHP